MFKINDNRIHIYMQNGKRVEILYLAFKADKPKTYYTNSDYTMACTLKMTETEFINLMLNMMTLIFTLQIEQKRKMQ